MFYLFTEEGWKEREFHFTNATFSDLNLQPPLTTVQEIMSTELVTVQKDDTLIKCHNILSTKNIRHLIVKSNDFTGIVSDRDIKFHLNTESFNHSKVHDILYPMTIAVHMSCPVGQVAKGFLEEKINSFPVLDDKHQLKGIVTSTDILKLFATYFL